jgi:hypothetical protein
LAPLRVFSCLVSTPSLLQLLGLHTVTALLYQINLALLGMRGWSSFDGGPNATGMSNSPEFAALIAAHRRASGRRRFLELWRTRCELARVAGQRRPSLMAVMARVFGWELLATAPLWIMGAAGDQAIPWVLNLTLRNIEDPEVCVRTFSALILHLPELYHQALLCLHC